MSPATAEQLGVELGSYAHGGEHGGYYMPVVELQLDGRKVRAPAWIMPGHADGTVTVYLGHGREHAGQVGGTAEQTVGFNAYLLRTADRPWFASGLQVVKTGDTELVACTQAHQSMEDREPVRAGTLAEYRENPRFAAKTELSKSTTRSSMPRKPITLYEPFDYAPPKHKWGMAIDLTACIGCHACVVACQAENNIAVVGKEQVARGREMHWLRVDRYIEGTAESPDGVPLPAGALHALRKRPLRVRLPGRGHGPQRRRAQRHGLQPLRGHAVLLEQLPLQGAAVQFPLLRRLPDAQPPAPVQSRRDGPLARRDGEVQLLRAADSPGGDRRRRRTSGRWRTAKC